MTGQREHQQQVENTNSDLAVGVPVTSLPRAGEGGGAAGGAAILRTSWWRSYCGPSAAAPEHPPKRDGNWSSYRHLPRKGFAA